MWKNVVSLSKVLYTARRAIHCESSRRCTSGINYSSRLITREVKYVNHQSQRCTSFFNKLPAEHLWKGVVSVSNAGKRRGRGKGIGKKTAKDLNRGQVVGVGKANIVWPGLNAPVIRGRELIQQQQLPEDKEREQKLIKLRDQMGVFRPLRFSPLERGWSGARLPGRSIGPPDPVGEDKFEGFDTKVLEFKTVINMKGNLGRKRTMSALVVTGNKNGLVGFALGKANESKSALNTAKNRAAQKLVYVERYNDHTILHDFFTQFGKTKIFVKKMPEGYGLICHRAIKEICTVVGIKDLHAKVEGSTNLGHIVKAFFHGLIQQKSYQQLAEEKKLHVVEFRAENNNLPNIIASPSECRDRKEIPTDEVLEFSHYVLGSRVPLQRKKFPPFYTKLPSWQLYLKKWEKLRNQEKVMRHMMVEYGEIRSFFTDKYPECKLVPPKPRLGNDAEEEVKEEEIA